MQNYKKKSYFCKIKKKNIFTETGMLSQHSWHTDKKASRLNSTEATGRSLIGRLLALAMPVLLALSPAVAQKSLDPAPIKGQQTVHHTAYTLSYCEPHEQPSWVSYLLTRDHALAERPRKDSFKADPAVRTGSATPKDYSHSGYDKGHLAPNADMRWDAQVQAECFYMSNMSPQTHTFNAGLWKRLEELVREWAIEYDSLYVVTGPLLHCDKLTHCTSLIRRDSLGRYDTLTRCIPLTEGAPMSSIGQENRISVPNYFYKVVLDNRRHQSIGFLVPHANKKGPLQAWAMPVDLIEEATGLDFFHELNDETEAQLEGNVCISCWSWPTN